MIVVAALMNGRKFFDVYSSTNVIPPSRTLKIQNANGQVVGQPTFAGLDLYDGGIAVDDQLLIDDYPIIIGPPWLILKLTIGQ